MHLKIALLIICFAFVGSCKKPDLKIGEIGTALITINARSGFIAAFRFHPGGQYVGGKNGVIMSNSFPNGPEKPGYFGYTFHLHNKESQLFHRNSDDGIDLILSIPETQSIKIFLESNSTIEGGRIVLLNSKTGIETRLAIPHVMTVSHGEHQYHLVLDRSESEKSGVQNLEERATAKHCRS